MLVARDLTVTLVPGIKAPDGSSTRPLNDAVWANRHTEAANRASRMRIERLTKTSFGYKISCGETVCGFYAAVSGSGKFLTVT